MLSTTRLPSSVSPSTCTRPLVRASSPLQRPPARRANVRRSIVSVVVALAGAADGFPDVLVVVPAVEDADLHELAVRAGAFGRESLAVPVLLRERAQRVEPARGNGTELVEHLRARPVAIALDPPLVRLAD